MKRGLLPWLRQTVRTKRGFLAHCMVVVGIPAAVMVVMGYRQYGGVGWTLYLICVAFAGVYVWALLMWHLWFKAAMESRLRALESAGQTDKHAKKQASP